MNITTYIRKENIDAWNAIPNKSEWINNQLSGEPAPTKERATPKPERPPIPDIPGLTTADKIKSNGACKIHGLPLTSNNKCLQKGCKYA